MTDADAKRFMDLFKKFTRDGGLSPAEHEEFRKLAPAELGLKEEEPTVADSRPKEFYEKLYLDPGDKK